MAKRVEAETLLDRSQESTNLYRREVEKVKTEQEVLQALRKQE